MRLLATADLHYNHGRSKPIAIDLINRMNQAGGDVLLLIGDTAIADGDSLQECLSLFTFAGPRLFLCGNHELWTRTADSHHIFMHDLPRRIRALGWHWLEEDPFISGNTAIVGTIGWYDYAFASARLAIPRRFYAARQSPAAARYLQNFELLGDESDIPESAATLMARWNDGKFIHLHRSDEQFLAECLARLTTQLENTRHIPNIIAATHCLPFAELLPPFHSEQWEFSKAYLGSPRLGELLRQYPNITHALCGHSHFPATAQINHIRAINIGSGYGWKTFLELDLPD